MLQPMHDSKDTFVSVKSHLAQIFSTYMYHHNINKESQMKTIDISSLFTWNRVNIYEVIEIHFTSNSSLFVVL